MRYEKVFCKFNLNDFSINNKDLILQVKEYSTKKYNSNVLKIYGISQDPDTNNFIIVLE